MKRPSLVPIVALGLVVATFRLVYAHCEIPCGIYGDKTRIDLLYEDVATIEKSMAQINELAGKTDAQSVNQVVRWIANKDLHADKIQETVTQYFMTQRVKPQTGEEESGYFDQITSLHAMLIAAMKCKQTVDAKHGKELRGLIDRFAASYFDEEDLNHIREHHGKHDEK